MASAIGTALFCSVLQPMAAKAMDIIKDKGLEIVRSMADKAMDNIERDISRLQTTLYMIQDIVPVAEEKQIDKQGKPVIFIQNWLHDLVDIGYEARDVLDDFITFSSYIITAYEEASNPVNFISSFMLSYVGGLSDDTSNIPLAILNRLEKNIRSVRERFDEKKKEGKTIKKEGSESVKNRRPEVEPSINKQSDYKFVEREEMKEGIMDKILHPEYDRVDVVAIWGMGGIGKTTLAQSIYNDKRVKEVPRSWLFVGENKFSAKKVMREMVDDQKNTTGIEKLQEKLVKKFRGNRFLIVLDDVWDVDSSEWDLLFNPLTEVGKGGLIIITTRRREVCIATKTQTKYDLRLLSEKDSWSLFESCAYKDGKSDSTPDLKRTGEEIVKKLNGHPLALKVVGCSLLDEDSSTWKSFLEPKLTNDDEVMSALRWSYIHLPPHLKMCFTYCALFPKDHVFDKKVLVEMWMAHDLIQKEEQKRPEDVGGQYLKQLVNASLLQCVDGKYVMHDLIHDLAVLVSNGEFASANNSLTNDQMKKVRHITITDYDYSMIPRLCKMEKLLTLYTIWSNEEKTNWCDCSVIDGVFKQLKSIRVLVLVSSEIKEIPDSISELRHLRYLDVRETDVKCLPDSFCRLYNLQMLAAPNQLFNKAKFPIDIVNISSLRYIRGNLSTCKGVGKLTSLQELSFIRVCKGDNIRELGDMQRLRGKLKIKIKGLENVEKLEDGVGALMDKQTLMDELELKFIQDSAKSTISEEVLDALGCPPNLMCLKIFGYTGVKPPSWMVDGKHKFAILQKLSLSNCPKLESLPPLGELTSLKHLCLWNVGVKRLGDEFYGKFSESKVLFPSLESLSFIVMKEWEEWDDIIIENSSVSFFPRLTELEIKNCDKLVSVLPAVVENLIMNATNFMTSLSSLTIQDCDGLKRLQLDALVSLKELKLSDCPNLESLPLLGELTSLKHLSLENVGVKILGDEFYGKFTDGKVFFPSLELLEFSFMDEWEEWDDNIIENSSVSFFPRLTELKIYRCWKLVSVLPVVKNPIMNATNFMTSLSSLTIQDCDGLKRLQLDALVSLKELKLSDCPKLESLPLLGELTSLKHLSLENVGVKRLGDEFYGKFTKNKVFFPSLESLWFFGMEEWEEWDDIIIIENSSVSFFPRLTTLVIYRCPKLVSVLPVVKNPIMNATNFMTSLSNLRISRCDRLKWLQLDALVSLKELKLSDCPKLESLPLLGELTSLKHLSLENVGVKILGDEFYGKFTNGKVFFPSLESLSFGNMKELEEWDDIIIENSSVSFFPRLTELLITHCPNLVSVLPVVKNPMMNVANFMKSLSGLEISCCDGLRSLPTDGLPPSLRRLTIRGCPLLYERCRDESGPDWHKINHIREIFVNIGIIDEIN